MNRTAQVFLGLAIAIVFPVFVLYAGVTFIPTRTSTPTPYPVSPSSPSDPTYGPDCSISYNASTRKYETANPALCASLKAQYARDLASYSQKNAAYERAIKANADQLKADQEYNDRVTTYRSMLGIGFALLGIVSIIGFIGLPALVYGLGSGAGFTLLVSITGLLTTSDTNLQRISAGLLAGLFLVLAALAVVFDRRFGASAPKLPQGFGSGPGPQPAPVEIAPVVQPAVVIPGSSAETAASSDQSVATGGVAELPEPPITVANTEDSAATNTESAAAVEPIEPVSSEDRGAAPGDVVIPKDSSADTEHNK